MKVSPKFEIKCDKCGCVEVVSPDRNDTTEPCWPDEWMRILIESAGGGTYALCGTCKKRFWSWMKEVT